jgi:hypothetical protein
MWRSLGPLRESLSRHPSVTKHVRRFLKLGWWILKGEAHWRLKAWWTSKATQSPSVIEMRRWYPPKYLRKLCRAR